MIDAAFKDKLCELIGALCNGSITLEDREQLGSLLSGDDQVRQFYIRYLDLHLALTDLDLLNCDDSADILPGLLAGLDACNRDEDAPSVDALPVEPSLAFPATEFNLFSTGLQGSVNYFPESMPLAYLVATLVMGLGLLIGAFTYVSKPEQLVAHSQSTLDQSPAFSPSREPAFVGQITGAANCEMADPKTDLSRRYRVAVGERFALASGAMEITYDTGARVILEGPSVYEVRSKNGGFLSRGKLTGKVTTEWAKGFSVRTPTAIVTDLGTEFGVEVDGNGTTTSYVFRGLVRVQPTAGNGVTTEAGMVLREKQAARVACGADRHVLVLTAEDLSARFIRETTKKNLSAETFKTVAYWQFDGKEFLADSSGHGHTLVNRGAKQVNGAAVFDGNAEMCTGDSIDLTQYTRIRVSWRQKTAVLTSDQVVWEHGANFNETPGAMAIVLEKGMAHAGIRTNSASLADGYSHDVYSVDQYPLLKDEWESLAVEFDRTAYRANVVRVFKDGREIPATTFFDGFAPKSFINAVFHIGAREGLKSPFVGQIDSLKIEGELPARNTEDAAASQKR
jgi:hypothetical protein